MGVEIQRMAKRNATPHMKLNTGSSAKITTKKYVVLPIMNNAKMLAQRDAKQSKHPGRKESVQHEEIPASFTVQKCVTVTERVCDTAYDTEITERDDFKCIHVPNTYCAIKERTVYDKTCRTMINFDCKPQEYGYGSSGSDEYGSSGYDSEDSYGASSS